MSGAPKRLQGHEGSHPMTSKRPLEEPSIFSNLSGKFNQSLPNEYHPPFVPMSDGRLAKVQRIEPRDADKRSSVLPLYRIPSSSFGSCLGHPVAAESRPELRDSKDNRSAKIENRETKADTRELSNDTRMDPQASKGEKDTRSDSVAGDKEIKSERESQTDFKGEIKVEKDGYIPGNSHLNCNEPKENNRGKRYSETPNDGMDPWRVARDNSRSMDDTGKEALKTEERECLEACEAVGENKVDWKAEEKLKEKEGKRKDEKYRDWGEREKDRNDHGNNLQLGSTSTERRELTREERELERWEMEKRDVLKDKERPKDREKDHIKREALNINEKEIPHNGKGLVDGSFKMPDQESSELEQKRLKQLDSLRVMDRDDKEQKREMDLDVEGDRRDKSGRSYKEPDDACREGDRVAERDREVFSPGVQQRRRMLRSRGTSQPASREPRFQPRPPRDNEGSRGKLEVSTVVYKAGECMQELLKLWKEYEASQDIKNGESSHDTIPTLEIRVPAEYVTATNRQVRGGQLWGTDIYTDDSDLVAVLMHTGYCRPTASPPPPAILELRATIRVLPPQDCYTSTLRNNVRSRAWGAAIGCSYRVERCCVVKKGGGSIDLEPCLTHISAVEPTLAPVAVERPMTTRAAASNALRQQRFVREVTIQYNLCNEPWIKYSIGAVADKGLKRPLYTSARLKKGEVLYLETHSNRYELCFSGERAVNNGASAAFHASESALQKLHNHNTCATQVSERSRGDRDDVFRWSRCKKPLPQKVMRLIGIPLPAEHLEILADNLDWEDVQWSQTGVRISGKEYTLARVHFLSPK
ncbi:uncharacterized protein LOC131242833 [Magnolia sinica]|uniref:uncharacterized protein LOC131242833 n=1 Tax=Magnolia sinica TaxID=86752 RepID=UPI0026591476|nr:uncharacterized protein LOC131242833 [Magnolia sinica]